MDDYVMIKMTKQDKLLLKREAEKERLSVSSFIRHKMLKDVKEF